MPYQIVELTGLVNENEFTKEVVINASKYELIPYQIAELIRLVNENEFTKEVVRNAGKNGLSDDDIFLLVRLVNENEITKEFVRNASKYKLMPNQIVKLTGWVNENEFTKEVVENASEYKLSEENIAKLIKSTKDSGYIKECILDKSKTGVDPGCLIDQFNINEILNLNIVLDEDSIEKIISSDSKVTIKTLFFSQDIDKEKLTALSKMNELGNAGDTISIDSIIRKSFSTQEKVDYDKLNEKISDVLQLLSYKNIPEFLKTFQLFKIGEFADSENYNIESYKNISKVEKEKIILADLFRISLDSNSSDLRNFAQILKAGDEILKYENGKYHLQSLSQDEQAVLSQYVDCLMNTYNNSLNVIYNKEKKIQASDNLLENLQQLERNGINSSSIFSILLGDEIEGKITPDDILQYMEQKQRISQERNIKNSYELQNGELKLEPGDFVKGIQSFDKYCSSILKNGIKGGEFNGKTSHSDATPLDADFDCIDERHMYDNAGREYSDRYKIRQTKDSSRYGPPWIVMKQYEKRLEEDKNLPIKFSRKPEFYSDDIDGRFIRTGIGTLDIDYIVTAEGQWKSRFNYEMAMAGKFIPVVDEKGEVIFSQKDYDKIRDQMKGLSYYGAEPFEVDENARNIKPLFELYKSLGGTDEEIKSIEDLLSGKQDEVTQTKKNAIMTYFNDFFKSKGIIVADNISHDLSSEQVELIDTGSTR